MQTYEKKKSWLLPENGGHSVDGPFQVLVAQKLQKVMENYLSVSLYVLSL